MPWFMHSSLVGGLSRLTSRFTVGLTSPAGFSRFRILQLKYTRPRARTPCDSAVLSTLLRSWLPQSRKNRKPPLLGPGLYAISLKNSLSTEKLLASLGSALLRFSVVGPGSLTTGGISWAKGRLPY